MNWGMPIPIFNARAQGSGLMQSARKPLELVEENVRMGLARRSFCLHSVALGMTLSGCITNPLGRSRKGGIIAIVVDDVPEEATVVDFSDSRLDDMPLVKEMVRDAVSGGSTGRTIDLNRAMRLHDELREELPYHQNGGGTGVYIRKGETVVRVSVQFEG